MYEDWDERYKAAQTQVTGRDEAVAEVAGMTHPVFVVSWAVKLEIHAEKGGESSLSLCASGKGPRRDYACT